MQCAANVSGHFLGIREFVVSFETVGHGGVDGARLDGDDPNVRLTEAIAQTFKKNAERAFSRTVDVVGAMTAVAGDGGDGSDAAFLAGFEIISEESEQGRGGDEIGVDFANGQLRRVLTFSLIEQRAVSEKHGVEIGQEFLGAGENGGVGGNIREVGGVGGDLEDTARFEIGGKHRQMFSAASHEEKFDAFLNEQALHLLRDSGRGAEDDSFFHGCSGVVVTRRQKDDDSFGSIYFSKVRQRGNDAANIAGFMRASFAG